MSVPSKPSTDSSVVFALGDSGGSDIANQKDALIAAAVAAGRSDSTIEYYSPLRPKPKLLRPKPKR